jgi:hypothetical protein
LSGQILKSGVVLDLRRLKSYPKVEAMEETDGATRKMEIVIVSVVRLLIEQTKWIQELLLKSLHSMVGGSGN